MKASNLIYMTLVLIGLTQCKSPTEEINHAFKTVNESIDKSNAYLSHSLYDLYYSIDSNRQENAFLALKADSLFNATDLAIKFIDSLKKVMVLGDTSGTNTYLAEKILIHSKTSDILKNNLLTVYNHSRSSLIDTSKQTKLDSALSSIRLLQVDKNWKRTYFEGVPTIAAVTILNNFQNECRTAAGISLLDIKQNMAK